MLKVTAQMLDDAKTELQNANTERFSLPLVPFGKLMLAPITERSQNATRHLRELEKIYDEQHGIREIENPFPPRRLPNGELEGSLGDLLFRDDGND